MKKDHTPSKQLGMPQKDLAMLLGVSRSLYSMFESGQRNLPTAASLLLTEMLAHFHAPQTQAKVQQRKAEITGLQHQLENLIRENEYQRTLIERKWAAAQKKHEAATRRAMVMEFLANHKPGMKNAGASLAKSTAEESLTAKTLLALELKKEALDLENRILHDRIKKIVDQQNLQSKAGKTQ